MKYQKGKLWVIGYLVLVLGALITVGFFVVKVDPFFHYHKPLTDVYFYTLNNQRSQNNGIVKNFDYDALITGTSMTENFKTSEMDKIFGTTSIKVSFSGGRYKEINDNVEIALSHNQNLKTVVRGLDMSMIILDKNAARTDLGSFPTYLYDDNIFNDVKYVFNRNVIFDRVYPMVIENNDETFTPGITSFDSYSNWMKSYTFGINTVCSDGIALPENTSAVHLSDEEYKTAIGNIEQNVISLASQYPDVTFYYFITPYSIIWWESLVNYGTVYKQIEAERLLIEEALKYDNIKLYSFNNLTDIITDLNNYKDTTHYGSWINSLILQYMKDEKCLLTLDNYDTYLNEELLFFTTFDYSLLNMQEDYEDDYYAEAMIYLKKYNVNPLSILDSYLESSEIKQSEIVENQFEGKSGLNCNGSLLRNSESGISIADYISTSNDYIGIKFSVDDISKYKYLTWYGIKNQDHGQPTVLVYDENNVVISEFSKGYSDLDNQWHSYMMDVSELTGKVTIVFNGGYIDSTGSGDSSYTFCDLKLY